MVIYCLTMYGNVEPPGAIRYQPQTFFSMKECQEGGGGRERWVQLEGGFGLPVKSWP